ncbi:hypothetical protein, partial [Actinomadura sp. B10D3]|uniref:hypothetical protein n=1 Tax=Actinomadura sp. B10D3 TaxID=3153557 RepID=UPI00325E3E53
MTGARTRTVAGGRWQDTPSPERAGLTAASPPPPGPNIVTARGPGNGANGYCVLAATAGEKTSLGTWRSTLPGRLHGGPMTMPANVTPTR